MRRRLRAGFLVFALLGAGLVQQSVGAKRAVNTPARGPVTSAIASPPGPRTTTALAAPTAGGADVRTKHRHGLSSGTLRAAVADPSKRGRHSPAGRPDLASVEVVHDGDDTQARSRIESLGGTVTGAVPGVLVQADVPWGNLGPLERSAGIRFVRPPVRVDRLPRDDVTQATRTTKRGKGARNVVGQEVAKINANAWHAAGDLGAGVKVGIIDVFSRVAYDAARRAKQVPAPAGTACFVLGQPCNALRITRKEAHGTAVAEVVHEMAPEAQLYLGFGATTSDLQAVVNSFASHGVKIITRSLTSAYDGPGDGTGPLATVINNAIGAGITWFNSAGNAAGVGSFPQSGSYYRGTFTDTNSNGFHEFAPGAEFIGLPCFVFTQGLRWDDFSESASNVTDFDLFEVDAKGELLDASQDSQGSSGGDAPPLENFEGGTSCGDRRGDLVFVAIKLVTSGSGSNDVLEFQNNGAPMTFSSNPFSAAVPACDVANPGLVCVGAIDPPLGIEIAGYSSQGPTNDNRIKPDVVAAACVNSFVFKGCFNGTSSSTPAAAAAAALVLGAGLGGGTPAGLGAFIRTAVVDRGASGPDNVFGSGELILPAPPP